MVIVVNGPGAYFSGMIDILPRMERSEAYRASYLRGTSCDRNDMALVMPAKAYAERFRQRVVSLICDIGEATCLTNLLNVADDARLTVPLNRS
jgi:hypothetical protein